MKRYVGYITSVICLGAAVVCLISGIGWKNSLISGNRYGSICAEGNDIYYYANHSIYKYSGTGNTKIIEEKVSPYFEIADNCLYYVSGPLLTGMELNSKKVKIQYQAEAENFNELQICGIKNGILKVELYQKNPSGSSYIYLDVKSGKNVGEKEKWWEETDNRIEEGYGEFLSGYTASALTKDDILYVRWPQGKSHISSYQVERDREGNISKVTLLEEKVPFFEAKDIRGIALRVSAVIFAIAAILAFGYSKNRKKN